MNKRRKKSHRFDLARLTWTKRTWCIFILLHNETCQLCGIGTQNGGFGSTHVLWRPVKTTGRDRERQIERERRDRDRETDRGREKKVRERERELHQCVTDKVKSLLMVLLIQLYRSLSFLCLFFYIFILCRWKYFVTLIVFRFSTEVLLWSLIWRLKHSTDAT